MPSEWLLWFAVLLLVAALADALACLWTSGK